MERDKVYDILKFARDGGVGNAPITKERRGKIILEEIERLEAEEVKEGVIDYLIALGLVAYPRMHITSPTEREKRGLDKILT